MNIVTLDCETYYDKDYTLTKMTTEAYVRDPRFELFGLAVRHPNGDVGWGSEPPQPFWSNCAILCHHAQFDGLILSHHFGIKPVAWLDTLSMARLLLGNHVKHSLDGLRAHFGMPAKRTPYKLFKGKHWKELTEAEQQLIIAGSQDEVQSIYYIFTRFMSGDY